MLSASISAVGQSALNSRYSKQLIERIASVLGEQHAPWLYPRAITALGQIGASKPLPDAVFTIANTLFTDPVRQGERENLAQAFSEIAKGAGCLSLRWISSLLHCRRNRITALGAR
jgi:hypothetical protein